MRRLLPTGFAAGALAVFAGCGSSSGQGSPGNGTLIASAKPAGSTPSGGGSDVGNGGSVITLPDGRVVIADPYFNRPEQGEVIHYSDFSPAIRTQIEHVGRLLVRLGAAVDENVDTQFPPQMSRGERNAAIDQIRLGRKVSRAAQARFVVESIADPVVEYHFVERIPSACRGGEEIGPSAAGGTVVLGGCNQGDAVWFQKDVFRSMSVRDGDPEDPREQVKWIIHERLHAINIFGHPHYYIADITNGIDLLLDLWKIEINGGNPRLTEQQQAKLSLLVERIAQFRGLTTESGRDDQFVSDWKIAANGGGLVHKSAVVDPAGFVGVGSVLGSGGWLGPGAKFVNALCFLASCSLGEGAIVRDSIISPRVSQRSTSPEERSEGAVSVSLARNASLHTSVLYLDVPASAVAPAGARLDESAVVLGSFVSGVTGLNVGARAKLMSRIEIEIRDDAATSVEIEADSELNHLVASFRTRPSPVGSERKIVVPAGVRLDVTGAGCAAPNVPWLNGTVTLDSGQALLSTCAPITR